MFTDHASMLAAGLAYYALFGLLPALAAAAALWSTFGDSTVLRQLLDGHGGLLPPAAAQVLDEFLTSVPAGLGGGLVLCANLVVVLWTASRAAGGLLTALNIIYNVPTERRRFARIVATLAIATGGIAVLFCVTALLAVAPLVAGGLPHALRQVLSWARWLVLVGLFAALLALLYRFGPNRTRHAAVPLLCGTAAGTALCLAASSGVALYAAHGGSFGRLYGSLGGIAVALLWLYAISFAVLIGAQVDAVMTARRSAS